MSRRRMSILAALLLLGALLATGCASGGPAASATPVPTKPPTPVPTKPPTPTESPKAFELVIVHTNDVRGYTDPCG
jgi:PBP1b-binding outer membrane lipoprotein LpoB